MNARGDAGGVARALGDSPSADPAPQLAERAPESGSVSEEAVTAFRNTFKLGGSLAFTWVIAVAVRVLLPRHLGPAAFGHLNFADAFAATAFVLVSLGVDLHLRKEYPIRPEIASETFAGLLVVRVLATLVLFAGLAVVLRLTERPPIVGRLVFFFGLGQLCMAVNLTLAALLQASGRIDGLSILSGASKLLWGLGIVVGIALHQALPAVAISFFVSEAVKAIALYPMARRHVGLRFVLDARATRAALAASLPYYINWIAVTAYARIDVTVLSLVIRDEKEMGWYGAASNVASLCLLATPLIGWVLLPLFARAHARAPTELRNALARSIEIVLTLIIPIALVVALGADLWVRIIFGKAFAPAALPLRVLAPMFILTYVAAVSAICLTVLGRGWYVTLVSTCALVLNPALNVVLVRLITAHHPVPGAAGVGAAIAVLLSEVMTASALTALLGAMAFDRRSVRSLWRMAASALLVVVLDRVLAPIGPVRIAIDAVAYAALVAILRAVRWGELRVFVRAAVRRPVAGT